MGGARGAGRRRVRVRGAAAGRGRVRGRRAVQRHVVVRGVGGRWRARAAADRARGVARVAARQPQRPRRQGELLPASVMEYRDLQLSCELVLGAPLVTCNSVQFSDVIALLGI